MNNEVIAECRLLTSRFIGYVLKRREIEVRKEGII
jgi:hypothetical protein